MEFAPLLFWVHVKKKWSKNKNINSEIEVFGIIYARFP